MHGAEGGVSVSVRHGGSQHWGGGCCSVSIKFATSKTQAEMEKDDPEAKRGNM